MGTPAFPALAPEAIAGELAEAKPELFSSSPTVLPVEKSFGHQTFRLTNGAGKDFLLKIARTEPEIARFRITKESVGLARAGGVAVPAALEARAGSPRLGKRPWLLQEFWPGRDAEDAWPSLNAPERDAIISAWGNEVGKLHGVQGGVFTEQPEPRAPDWIGQIQARLERLVQLNRKAGALTEAEQRSAERQCATLLNATASVVTPVLTHRDLCLKNVLLDRGNRFAGLLDFEHARFSDPVMDFVKLEHWVFEKHPGTEQLFFRGYRAARPQPWPLQEARKQLHQGLELLGEIPYYKRNAAREAQALEEALSRLRAWLVSSR